MGPLEEFSFMFGSEMSNFDHFLTPSGHQFSFMFGSEMSNFAHFLIPSGEVFLEVWRRMEHFCFLFHIIRTRTPSGLAQKLVFLGFFAHFFTSSGAVLNGCWYIFWRAKVLHNGSSGGVFLNVWIRDEQF